MRTRFVVAALLVCSLTACHRTSANERKVIGTWKQNSFDGTEYYILNSDHSYAYVGEIPDEDYKVYRPVLCCSGTWRVEGDDLILDCTVSQSTEKTKIRPPQKHSDRWKIAEFIKKLEPHPPVSYETL